MNYFRKVALNTVGLILEIGIILFVPGSAKAEPGAKFLSPHSNRNSYLLNQSSLEADSSLQEANRLFDDRDYSAALGLYQQVLKQCWRDKNVLCISESRLQIGETYYRIGEAYRRLQNYSEAINYYHQALATLQDLEHPDSKTLQGRTLNSLGIAHRRLGDYGYAQRSFEESLSLHRQEGNQLDEGNVLNNLGLLQQTQSAYLASLEYFQIAANIFETLEYFQSQQVVLGNIGLTYGRLGQYEKALSTFEEALSLGYLTENPRGEAFIVHNIGFIYIHLQDYENALKFTLRAIELQQNIGNLSGESESLDNLAYIFLKTGDYSQALANATRAFEISVAQEDQLIQADSLYTLGQIYVELELWETALQHYLQSNALRQSFGDLQGQAVTLQLIGQLYQTQNQTELAIVFHKQAVNLIEQIRDDLQPLPIEQQRVYADTVTDLYRDLADLLLEQGRLVEAQQVLDLLKIEELREFNGTRAIYTSNGLELYEAESEVFETYESLIRLGILISDCDPDCAEDLYDQRRALKAQYDQVVRGFQDFVAANRAVDDQFYNPEQFSTDARDLVNAQPGTVLIYPVVLEDELWLLWTTTGNVVGTITQKVPVSQLQLAEAVRQFRELLRNGNSDLAEVQRASQQLYDWLIAPLEEELEKNDIQQLVFAQDRHTRYIPMAALHDGDRYLLENYTVYTVLSAALTDTTDRLGTVDSSPVLGLGLTQAVADLDALPGVTVELDEIVRETAEDTAGIYPGQVFLDDDFTFETLTRNVRRNRILHLATHAKFVVGDRYASYLVLGNGDRLSIPRITEIADDLENLHLVVLSACQTALGGPGADGTEIAGLSAYFLGPNKAEAVLASLWAVNDTSTSLLMQRFYENLASGEHTKAEALRQAQLAMLGSDRVAGGESRFINQRQGDTDSSAPLSHPYYWAPFILIGNGL